MTMVNHGHFGHLRPGVGRHTARHAVLWENGGVTDIGNLGANWWNTPTAINHTAMSSGLTVTRFVEGDILHAFIWTKDNGIQALKPLRDVYRNMVDSEAYGINERRQVVGVSCDANFVDCRAVVWNHGVYPTDLNDLKGDYSAHLESAKDINNLGEITGRAVDPNTGVRTALFGGTGTLGINEMVIMLLTNRTAMMSP